MKAKVKSQFILLCILSKPESWNDSRKVSSDFKTILNRVLSRIYRFGKKSQVADSDELPWADPGVCPRKVFEMNMRWDAIWCILRHNFEKWYSVCTDLVASGWFFRYSYLYIVMITIFFWRKLGILILGGGSFYPSNTLDRTLLKKRLCELAVSSALRKAKDVNQS